MIRGKTAKSLFAIHLDALGGVGLANPTDIGEPMGRFVGVSSHAVDPDDAARLWALSAELTGVNAF